LAAVQQAVSDPNFEYTTLLLPGNGTNGAQNNTFLDSSTNNFTITRNGNTTQGTFSPFSQTGWGNYFDGTGDYLTAGSSISLSSSFTVEGWVYITSTSATTILFGLGDDFTSTGFSVFISTTGQPRVLSNNAYLVSGSAGQVVANQWNHIAFVRNSTSLTLYINGVSVGTGTSSATFSGTAYIGAENYNTTVYPTAAGYISNLRVVTSAVYTSGFTPPTTPLTAITNTSLLTCQSNRFVDNSTNAFAITRNGDVSVQAFSPFNPTAAWSAATYGGSGYFDGSGDYLEGSANLSTSTSMSTFTIECWIYPTTFANVISVIGDMSPTSASDTKVISADITTAGKVQLYWYDGAVKSCTGDSVLQLNAWNYFAIVVNSNAISIYVNKTAADTLTGTTTLTNRTQTRNFSVGAYYNVTPFKGYLGSTRFSTSARTISAVPTTPLTSDANTRLLLNFTNAGIYDATSKNDLETVGNAQISTTQSKFGGSSMYFDGTGDYLVPNVATSNLYAFGSGDWTVEMWVYSATNQSAMLLDWRPTSTSGAYITWYLGTGVPVLFVDAADRIIGGSAIPTNAWVHLAICRASGSTKMFVNGTQSGSTYSDSNVYLNSANRPLIASNGFTIGGSPSYFTGYIDDLRVTKGIARYTSNFTPPTTAFPLL
jgi:hypothetical protein